MRFVPSALLQHESRIFQPCGFLYLKHFSTVFDNFVGKRKKSIRTRVWIFKYIFLYLRETNAGGGIPVKPTVRKQ